jgi:archaellum component FlaC
MDKKKAKGQAKLAQKRAKTQVKLDKLMQAMSAYSLQTDKLRKEFLENDGEIDPKEQKRLDSIDKRIAKVIAKVGKIRTKMPALAVEDSGQDDKRAAMTKELEDLSNDLENMIMVYSMTSTQHPNV